MGFGHFESFKPLLLSLPNHDDFKSLLSTLSTRLTDRYLVVRVIQYYADSDLSVMRYFCDIAKPFVWYRNEIIDSASEEESGDELRAGMESDQNDGGQRWRWDGIVKGRFFFGCSLTNGFVRPSTVYTVCIIYHWH